MNIKLAGLGLTAILALAACGQTTPRPSDPSNASVSFTLPASGMDYQYELRNSAGTVVRTSADDKDADPAMVRLDGLAAGTYQLTFMKEGFQSQTVEVVVSTSGAVTVDNVPVLVTGGTGGGGTGGGSTGGTIVTGMSGDFYLQDADNDQNKSKETAPLTIAKGKSFYAVMYVRDAEAAHTNAKIQMNMPSNLMVEGVTAKYTMSASATTGGAFPYGTGAAAMDAVYNSTETPKNVSATIANLGKGIQVVLAAKVTVPASATSGTSYCFSTPNIPAKMTEPTNKTTAEANLRCVKVQ